MNTSNKYFWYVLDGILFLLINIVLIWKLRPQLEHVNLSWMWLVVFGLAVFRAANLISNEKVAAPLRAPFVDEEIKDGKKVEVPKPRGFEGAMGNLIYCPSFTGTWVSMILFYSWLAWPIPTQAVAAILALSGIERIFTLLSGYLKK